MSGCERPSPANVASLTLGVSKGFDDLGFAGAACAAAFTRELVAGMRERGAVDKGLDDRLEADPLRDRLIPRRGPLDDEAAQALSSSLSLARSLSSRNSSSPLPLPSSLSEPLSSSASAEVKSLPLPFLAAIMAFKTSSWSSVTGRGAFNCAADGVGAVASGELLRERLLRLIVLAIMMSGMKNVKSARQKMEINR